MLIVLTIEERNAIAAALQRVVEVVQRISSNPKWAADATIVDEFTKALLSATEIKVK